MKLTMVKNTDENIEMTVTVIWNEREKRVQEVLRVSANHWHGKDKAYCHSIDLTESLHSLGILDGVADSFDWSKEAGEILENRAKIFIIPKP